MEVWLHPRTSFGAIVLGHWFCIRFPWAPLLYSERYCGETGFRFAGFRFHMGPFGEGQSDG